ncbi:hypothetical protein DBR40_22300 [Pedobacter sp. KBW01]|uniref:hypothetical protein n=1 Tax=Pedobacter sp. KBW01 TaxID=2153364 RepID=UPI000F597814|nr:hypothetical protein [Pedobacter sp. KBW01]RQO66613.1 hypothetical protein DBR40_22300 [Pedobacter sp. KBW01]
MNPIDRISRRINTLIQLPEKKDVIFMTDIKKEYRQDLSNFIVGETLTVIDGKVVIGKNLYKRWLHKIRTRGFDYDVKFI